LTDQNYAIGIDLGGTFIKTAVVTANGNVLHKHQIDTPTTRKPDDIIKIMSNLVSELLEKYPQAIGIGIGSPGLVDKERNLIRESPNFPSWINVPLRQAIADHVHLPVFLENDVNCFGLAEHRWGAGEGTKYMLALALGTGVGGAVIIEGKLYRGCSGSAGELGHISVDRNGPQCLCGNLGCLERYLGNSWFLEAASEELSDPSLQSPVEVSERAKNGDRKAVQFLEGRGEILGSGCVSLMNIFDPEMIVIGGGLSKVGEPLFNGIWKIVRERAYASLAKKIKIVPAKLGTTAGALGAAAVGFEAGESQ